MPNGVTWVTFKDFSCLRLCDTAPENNYVYFPAGSDSLMRCQKIHSIAYDDSGNEWILTDCGAINYTRDLHIPGNYRYVYEVAGRTILVSSDGTIMQIDERGNTEKHTTLASKDIE